MRVFILSDVTMPTPSDGVHGLGRVVSIVAEGLLKQGHDVVLFAKTGSKFPGALVQVDASGYEGEKVLAAEALKLHREFPADVILDCGHLHYLARMMPDLPICNVYHDRFQSYARCPILLSEGQQVLMGVEFDSTRIIPNALDVSQYVPCYEAARPHYALFAGALSELKQPILAIEACARLSMKLVIAGQELAGHLPLTGHSNVEYVGIVTGERKAKLFREAALFLQLGTDESFGLTTLEASLYGTPVVGWSAGGTLTLVRQGVNGALINPLGKDKVQNVCDAMQVALTVPRGTCRAFAEMISRPEQQVAQYENALSACMRGEGW